MKIRKEEIVKAAAFSGQTGKNWNWINWKKIKKTFHFLDKKQNVFFFLLLKEKKLLPFGGTEVGSYWFRAVRPNQ